MKLFGKVVLGSLFMISGISAMAQDELPSDITEPFILENGDTCLFRHYQKAQDDSWCHVDALLVGASKHNVLKVVDDDARIQKLKAEGIHRKIRLSRDWFPLESYRGRYYLTSENMETLTLTDSMLYHNGGAPFVENFHHFRSQASNLFSFKVTDPDDNQEYQTTIYIIDVEKGVSVWETSEVDSEKEPSYRLMVSRDGAANFDYIDLTAQCDGGEWGLEYDAINFKKLLRHFKKNESGKISGGLDSGVKVGKK